jgi:ribonuclease HI
MLQLFTDGASSKDGRGGWAFVAIAHDIEAWRDYGGTVDTTNQRMEIEATIRALTWAPVDVAVEIVSDSAYVVNCFHERWFDKWESSGWQKGGRGGPVANRDLWERLLHRVRLRTARTTFRHVKGHAGHRWNERADELAGAAKAAVGTPLPSLSTPRDMDVESRAA